MKPVTQYISFTGASGSYGLLPLDVLPGATTFTIEVKFSATATASSSSNYQWKTLVGRELGGYWQNDFGLCVNGGKLCFWAEPKSGGSSSTCNTTTNAIVNDGKIHTAAVVSSGGAIDLYCDDELVAHTDNVNAKITDSYKIYLAGNSNSKAWLAMNFYEARFWSVARSQAEIFANIEFTEEGLEAWYIPTNSSTFIDKSGNGRDATLYGSPVYTELTELPLELSFDVERKLSNVVEFTEEGLEAWYIPTNSSTFIDKSGNGRDATLYGSPVYTELTELPLELSFDVERKLSNVVEFTADVERTVIAAWRYENAGTADSLTISGTTLTNLPETKSITGTAFYQTASAKCFDLPASPAVWMKFDVYFNGSSRWRAYNGGSNGLTGITAQQTNSYKTISVFSNSQNVQQTHGFSIPNQLQTVLLHMTAGSANGVVEAWVDGTKIYTYTGDVNHGQDFADLYLQSDGSGTFFSNVIISNVEIELYENAKFTKEIELSFDVTRKVIDANNTWRYENAGTADSLTISGTTLTNLPETKSITGTAFYQTASAKCFDLPASPAVWMKFDVYFNGSSRWRAYNGGSNDLTGITAQTDGRLSFFSNSSNKGDYSGVCKVNQLQTVLLHMVSGSSAGVVEAWIDGTKIYTFTGDVNHGQDFADLYLQSDGSGTFFSNVIISDVEIKLGEGWHASNSDIERRIINVVEVVADTERITTNQGVREFSFDSEVNILRSLDLTADVQRNVQLSLDLDYVLEVFEAIPVEVVDDVARFLLANIILFPIDNSQYFPSQTPALRAPMLRANSEPTVIPSQARPFQANNTQGIQSFEVLLEEHQLSAQVKFTSVIPLEPLQAVSGQFLDYSFAMFVENTRQEGILISCDCSSSIDELLYSQLNYSVEEDATKYLFDFHTNQFSIYSGSNDYSSDSDDETAGEEEKHTEIVKKATASTHLKEIVRQLFGGDDSALEQHFTDFDSNLDVEQKDISFSDLISSLFGWSSRIPNKQINIFARVVDGKEKLFVIERGQEPNSIDISGTKHTLPIIEKSIIRTFVGSSPDSSYTMNIQLPGKFLCPPPPNVSPDGKTFYDYKNVSGYGDIENGYALESSTTYNDDGSKLEVSYIYEEVNGVYSCVKEVSRSYDENGELIDKKTTIHHRLSPSQQFSRMDDEDGNALGSNVSSNLPGFYNEKITLIEPSTNTKTITISGNPLVDMSFPFIDIEDFERVSQDLIALNRSIQETVSLTIYDYPHLINFTDRIYFKGNEYFLISNSALSSHNIFCQQSIVMRRWSNVS